MTAYIIGPKVCYIDFVDKADGYFNLYPTSCVKHGASDDFAIFEQEVIEPFDLSFKVIDQNKLSVKISGQPEIIYTRCHLLRNAL